MYQALHPEDAGAKERVILYLAKSYQDYILRTGQDIYGSRTVKLPKPEIYVNYTGSRKTRPETISYAKEFFPGEECCLDVTVHMIYDGEKNVLKEYLSGRESEVVDLMLTLV